MSEVGLASDHINQVKGLALDKKWPIAAYARNSIITILSHISEGREMDYNNVKISYGVYS